MMTNLVERLRAEAKLGVGWSAKEAADEIDALRARVAELEGVGQWQPIEALPELPMDERIIVYWPNEKIIAMKSIRGITCLRQKDLPSHWRPMLFKAPETTA